jgi:hypothetical protein
MWSSEQVFGQGRTCVRSTRRPEYPTSFVTSKGVFIGTSGNDPVGVGGHVTINKVKHYQFDLSEQLISAQAIFQSRIPQIRSHGRIHTTPSWVSP